MGIKPNQRVDLLENRDKIEDAYWNDGKTLDDMAVIYNCSRQLLARYMDKMGIRRRLSGEAAHLKRKQLGKRGPNWKGGRWIVKSSGYVFVYAPNHPRAMKNNGCIQEHILIAEEKIGRPLQRNEVVHHRNKDRADNRKSNLLVLKRIEHSSLHVIVNILKKGILTFNDLKVLVECEN